MKRLVSFDYIRVVSVLGILLCHCCFGISGMDFLGKFLGSTFNVVFLTLSAFLLGLSWERKQFERYNTKFLFHRIGKLAYAYYPFLLIMFAFLAFTGYHTTIKDWIMHFLFLPWFDKLPGFGHLWFITMIAICYTGVYIISNISRQYIIKYEWIGAIVAILSQFVLGMLGLPNYMMLYLALYLLVFLNARKILEYVDSLRVSPILITACIVLSIVVYLFYAGKVNNYTSVWGGLLSAVVLFGVMNTLFRDNKECKIVSFISSISFEIYLVHHVLCFGQYSIFTVVRNPFLGVLVIIMLSILLAYSLHFIGEKINSWLRK